MTKITVDSFTENELKVKLSRLDDQMDWGDECGPCCLPQFLHRGPCTRKEETKITKEKFGVWSQFRKRMKPILNLKKGAKMEGLIIDEVKRLIKLNNENWQKDQEEKTRIEG